MCVLRIAGPILVDVDVEIFSEDGRYRRGSRLPATLGFMRCLLAGGR